MLTLVPLALLIPATQAWEKSQLIHASALRDTGTHTIKSTVQVRNRSEYGGEMSLRHVAMVAKSLDLSKTWSCKYGGHVDQCAPIFLR